jgi:hypothetical protein
MELQSLEASSPLDEAEIAISSGFGDVEAGPPTFEQLERCDWGAHVTVRGQPARFNNAGVVRGERVVVVLADSQNAVLTKSCFMAQAVSELEDAYYFPYDRAELRMGTPQGAPMLPEQAAACLRRGDRVTVDGVAAVYAGMELCDDDLVLMMRLRQATPDVRSGAQGDAAWSVRWRPGLQVRLVSASLPTFEDLRQMPEGTPVTVGSHAVPAKLRGTSLRDGTRMFVLVQAQGWLKLREADSRPSGEAGEWVYRIRYEEAVLRIDESR